MLGYAAYGWRVKAIAFAESMLFLVCFLCWGGGDPEVLFGLLIGAS